MTIEKILFYGIIIVGAALIIGLTYYRIDWARHPEKYQDLVDQAEKAGRIYTVSYCFPPDPVPTAAGPVH